jgi:hypothetical protein
MRRFVRRFLRGGFWLAAGFAIVAGLAAPTVRAQEWYELYADGQQALRNGQPGRAVDLLKRAIQKRAQPGVNIPTYGTNSEPRYFPYLRLADAYLRLGAYDDAVKVLETSARLAVEPAAERATLEARAKGGLEVKRPRVEVIQSPAPAPPTAPPIAPAETSRAVADSARTALIPPAPPPRPPPTPPSVPTGPVDPIRRGSAALDLTSEPPGAQVYVDNEPVGRTDPQTGRLLLTSLRPGRHRVRLSAEGHDDLVKEIDLVNQPVTFHGVLSLSRPAAPVSEVPKPQTEPGSVPRWLVYGAILLIAVAGSLWLWASSRSLPRPEPIGPPTQLTGATGAGSYEDFPVEFGDYLLIRRIGKGGMATVYEAERRGERFALKRPLAGHLADPRFLERFVREADLGRALHHPNIIRIFDRGQVGNVPYFVMELVEGETLRDRLDREGRLDPRYAASITARVAEALDYAHHKGVIHRDLKPSNIMLERSGGVKVMDYGIARAQHLEAMTATGGFIGTPQYAAPEAVDALTEPRSDLYSLGVVFFEMLTGSLPFRGENGVAVLHGHCVLPPPAPSSLNAEVPEALDRIVLQLLSKEPSDRPTAEALLNHLADYAEEGR